jgi:hypothetical protein
MSDEVKRAIRIYLETGQLFSIWELFRAHFGEEGATLLCDLIAGKIRLPRGGAPRQKQIKELMDKDNVPYIAAEAHVVQLKREGHKHDDAVAIAVETWAAFGVDEERLRNRLRRGKRNTAPK